MEFCSFPGDDEDSVAPSSGGGPGRESFVSFCFCSTAGSGRPVCFPRVLPLPAVGGTRLLKERAISFSSRFSGSRAGEAQVDLFASRESSHCQLWAVPTFSKKEQFPFPPGSQVHGLTVCDALPPHSCPQPILPAAKRVRLGDAVPPHTPLASPPGDSGSSARMGQNAVPSVPSSPTPLRCTTVCTSVVPLVPLARYLGAWLALPSPSRWLIHTIPLGYAIQFTRRPPKYSVVLETSVAVQDVPVLREEIADLLAKDAIEPVPPAEMRQGFYSPYAPAPQPVGASGQLGKKQALPCADNLFSRSGVRLGRVRSPKNGVSNPSRSG